MNNQKLAKEVFNLVFNEIKASEMHQEKEFTLTMKETDAIITKVEGLLLNCVYLLQHKETRRIHGLFDSQEKADNYRDGSDNISIIKLEIG